MPVIELVSCERQNLRLTEGACRKSYQSAAKSPPAPWEGRWHCRGCQTGAARCGTAVDPLQQASESWKPVCPRCERSGLRIINGRLCVSCFNAQGYADRGVNRRGHRPGLCDRLHTQRLAIAASGAVTVQAVAKVVSRTEAVLAVARHAAAPVLFGLAPLVLPI